MNSQAPTLFWFYRLVGLGAIVGAVALGRKRSGGLGTIPPRPVFMDPNEEFWIRKTFAKGTPVVLVRDHEIGTGYSVDKYPAGTKAVVSSIQWLTDGYALWIEGTIREDLFTSSSSRPFKTLVEIEDVRPLVDNWGPLTISSPKRHATPPQRGWAKQLRQSRRRP